METKRIDRQIHRLAVLLGVLLLVLLVSACESTRSSRASGGFQGVGDFDVVVVDAGHGGHDTGAKAANGAFEKQLTLDTARRVARSLRAAGLRVVETRTDDTFIPLDQRVDRSNNLRNVVFVSVHYNWAKRAKPSGVETYYFSPRSARLAANIQREIAKVSNSPDRGTKQRSLYVLRNNKRPAVLCELGFVSNPSENRRLQTADGRQRLAEAVVRGILAEKSGRNP